MKPWLIAFGWIAFVLIAGSHSELAGAVAVILGALYWAVTAVFAHIDQQVARIDKRLDDANIF